MANIENHESSRPKIIQIKLTRQEANCILRALARYQESENNEDGRCPTWVADRLLNLLQKSE